MREHGLDSNDGDASSKEKVTTDVFKSFPLIMLKLNEMQPKVGK